MAITKVWIEVGCIECRWCYDLAPEIFAFGNGTSVIRGDARVDGSTDTNGARSALVNPIDGQMAEFLQFVAGGCPTAVIKLEGQRSDE